MINYREAKKGDHFWALFQGKALVVMKDDNSDFYACGGWECPMNPRELNLLEKIDIPESLKQTELYYL